MRLLVAILLSLFVVSCSEPVTPTLEVTPGSQTLASGQTLQLTVTRRYPGNAVEDVTSKVTYVSSSRLVAAVDASKGIVTAGEQTGAALIRIVDPSSEAVATTTLTIVPSAIQSIDITPSPAVVVKKGEKRAFTASGHLNNGVVADVTPQVVWSVANESIASIGNTTLDKGIVTALTTGLTEVQALDPVTGVSARTTLFVNGDATFLTAIVVSPNPATVKSGGKVQFTAHGILTDGTTVDVSKSVTWTSSGLAYALVDVNGLASGVLVGEVTINAIGPDPNTSVRGSASLTITPP